jgi:hypothetical protein
MYHTRNITFYGGGFSLRRMGTGIPNISQKIDKAQNNIYKKTQSLFQLCRELLHKLSYLCSSLLNIDDTENSFR